MQPQGAAQVKTMSCLWLQVFMESGNAQGA